MTGSWEGRAAGAPPPCRGVASGPSARLDNAFWPIHRRSLGAPSPDEGRFSPLVARRPLDAGDVGHSPPLRCPGFGEGSPAVTNPQKSPRFLTRPFATGRGLNFWGLVTAHSRAPRQRSRPTREASLGLGLTSARPGGRFVGLSVARHIVLGRWRRARSRRIEGPT